MSAPLIRMLATASVAAWSVVSHAVAADRAVVIGIDDYSLLGPGVSLTGAVNDARDFRDVLTTGWGFSPGDVTLLVNGDASSDAIIEAVFDRLIGETGKGDRAVFYFAGLGSLVDGETEESVLIAHDADTVLGRIPDIALGDLFDLLEGRDVTVVIDASVAGELAPTAEAARHVRSRGLGSAPGAGGAGGFFDAAGADRSVWVAAAPSQFAWEADARGVFTQHFTRGLRGGAADLDGDGAITNGELLTHLAREMADWCDATPECAGNGAGQTPQFRGDPASVILGPGATPAQSIEASPARDTGNGGQGDPNAFSVRSRIRALVIGIDAYRQVPGLAGAVNDARDISAALEARGAAVTLLIDKDATRERILGEWRRLAQLTGDDDLLVISYAGHGSNEPEFWPGNEVDGRDETFLLSGFAPTGPDAAERIRDDEIAELLALSPPQNTVFLADACHSGTVSRSVRPVLGYRYVAGSEIVDDPLPPPPRDTAGNEGRADLGMFLAAVDESSKVPEFLIDGAPRGALSYAFASALRGAADTDGDKALTVGEIETYVRRTVRNVSHGLQRPQISRNAGAGRVLIAMDSGDTAAAPPVSATGNARSAWDVPFAGLPIIAVDAAGGDTVAFDGARMSRQADVVIGADGTMRSSVGDILGVAAVMAGQQRFVDKMRLVRHLEASRGASLLDVYFTGGDRDYFEGEQIEIRVTGRQSDYLTLFNLAADGEIAFLYPDSAFGDPSSLDPAQDLRLPLGIRLPAGADHVFAVETDTAPDALRETLKAADGSRDVRALWEALRGEAASMGGDIRLAVFPFFTLERP